ncbi:MAG: peptidylprolyl isomerase [Clostridiales bacterium]|nr:peptidylprolyl isomerase [Clostridiales bacterium]
MKKLLKVALGLITVLALTSCAKKTPEPTPEPTPTPTPEAEATASPEATEEARYKEVLDIPELPQLTEVQPGEDIAVLTTNMGVIKMRFFPEQAPLAVENFITHAKNGYYNGTIFHRVIKDFMIQGGDPLGTGQGGESIWNAGFATEATISLHHLRGAVSMARTEDPDSNGSQFFIVQNSDLGDELRTAMEETKNELNLVIGTDEIGNDLAVGEVFPEVILDKYIAEGGVPSLDTQYAVFGQVIEGMDVVDKIAAVEVEVDDTLGKSKPLQDVVIEGIVIEQYAG